MFPFIGTSVLASTVVAGAIDPPGDEDVIKLDFGAPGSSLVDISVSSPTTCDDNDVGFVIRNEQGDSLAESTIVRGGAEFPAICSYARIELAMGGPVYVHLVERDDDERADYRVHIER